MMRGRTRSSSRSHSTPAVPTSPEQQQSSLPSTGGPAEMSASPASLRTSFLPSFMQRSRARSSTLTRLATNQTGPTSPSRPVARGRSQTSDSLSRSASQPAHANSNGASPNPSDALADEQSTYRIRLVPHLQTSRSIHFEPVVRDMKPCIDANNSSGLGTVVKIGRFTPRASQPAPVESSDGAGADEPVAWAGAGGGGNVTDPSSRDNVGPSTASANPPGASTVPTSTAPGGGGGTLTSNKIAFKSKVVSRGHAEVWVQAGGQFYIRDTCSSSGTFLNHIRLSDPMKRSRPFPIKDGDVIQLGVDYQGGTEEQYRCIKIKVEVGRQKSKHNNFNKEAMKQLQALGSLPESGTGAESHAAVTMSPKAKGKASVTDCCICLFSVTVCQALFIAPCSHVFHYKCIRPILQVHHPGFSCPLCRTFHDLDEDVELEDAWEVASRRVSAAGRPESVHVPAHEGIGAEEVSAQVQGTSDAVGLGPPLEITNDGEAPGSTHVRNDDTSSNSDVPSIHEPEVPAESTLPERLSTHTGGSTSSTSSLANMSLGALPVPLSSHRQPSNNSNGMSLEGSYDNTFGLDAATPMNTTFLSTLADVPVPAAVQEDVRAEHAEATGMDVDVEERVGDEERDQQRKREVESLYT